MRRHTASAGPPGTARSVPTPAQRGERPLQRQAGVGNDPQVGQGQEHRHGQSPQCGPRGRQIGGHHKAGECGPLGQLGERAAPGDDDDLRPPLRRGRRGGTRLLGVARVGDGEGKRARSDEGGCLVPLAGPDR